MDLRFGQLSVLVAQLAGAKHPTGGKFTPEYFYPGLRANASQYAPVQAARRRAGRMVATRGDPDNPGERPPTDLEIARGWAEWADMCQAVHRRRLGMPPSEHSFVERIPLD